MNEPLLADFVGPFDAETADWDGPTEGRVLVTSSRIVLAASRDEKVTIPLTSVFDVTIDSPPTIFDRLPGRAVTVAFEHDGRRVVAAVSGDESTNRKFATVLYRSILDGTAVAIKHPARRGGRVTNASFQTGALTLAGGVAFDLGEETVRIEPTNVTDFDRDSRDVEGQTRPVLSVRHMHGGTALTTLAATNSTRTLSILGRYLRQKYDDLLSAIRDLSLTEDEVQTLVTLHSTRGMDASLTGVLGTDGESVKRLLASLRQKDLVAIRDGTPEPTTRGQLVVNHYMDRVNT